MPLAVSPVATRAVLQNDPDHDFQSWLGIADDGNAPRWSRMRSEHKRCWCSITNHATLLRQVQGVPGSFAGHMPTPGELVLWTNHNPGRTFRVEFDRPVRAVALDVEATPAAVVPGQRYRVDLDVSGGGNSASTSRTAIAGTSTFVGLRCPTASIETMEVRVVLLDAAGQPLPSDFAVNRIELLAPMGNAVV